MSFCSITRGLSPDWMPMIPRTTISMTNNYRTQARRLQYQVDVTLANEQYFPSSRRGWQNVMAGDTRTMSWWQTIPNGGTLAGDNLFELLTEDVTPAPYNQPPYPPAGDQASDNCTVIGMVP